MNIFKLPDLGEGLKEAEIVEWHVKEGDIVKLHQDLVAMETAKAVVEVPSPMAGKIIKLYGKKGDIINTGAPLAEFESEEPIRDTGTVAGQLKSTDTVIAEPASVMQLVKKEKLQSEQFAQRNSVKSFAVTPAVRALAQKMGVDLALVTPTGANGTITREDVQRASQTVSQPVSQTVQLANTVNSSNTFNTFNTSNPSKPPEGYEPLRGVRKAMAETMTLSHQSVVPVMINDDAHLLNWDPAQDITVKIIQAIVHAAKIEPAINAWYDGASKSRKLHAEVDLALAMDTEHGLFTPVIRASDTDSFTSSQKIRKAIDTFKQSVNARTISPEDMKNATLTLSNFGKFAGRYANPIIIPPMVAIVGAGRLRQEAVVNQGKVEVAWVLPLSVSVDHRAVTGGEATRFLGELIKFLEKKN